MTTSPKPSPVAACLACLVLAGCAAPLQPVADFGAAARHLAEAYKPFTSGLGDSCEQRARYKAIGNAGAFDDAAAQREAARECRPLKEAAATAALFAKALGDYAAALASLSGVKANAFDSELRGVSSAAAKLENRAGDALFDSAKLSAASRLARAAAQMTLEGRQRRLTRATLQDNQEALGVVVEAMKTYAGAIYAGQLRDTHDVMAGELARLVLASTAATQAEVEARLPWRFAQAGMRADLAANELEARHVQAFARSADALLAAHAALVSDFDQLGDLQRLAQVADFVTRVQEIGADVGRL